MLKRWRSIWPLNISTGQATHHCRFGMDHTSAAMSWALHANGPCALPRRPLQGAGRPSTAPRGPPPPKMWRGKARAMHCKVCALGAVVIRVMPTGKAAVWGERGKHDMLWAGLCPQGPSHPHTRSQAKLPGYSSHLE